MRNWWGSTDVRVIDAKIHGSWLGFDFFTVNYVPFLTVPDSLAPRWDVSGLPSGPYPSSLLVSPVLTPSVSPVLPDLGDSVGLGLSWVEFALGLLVGAVVVLLVVWVVFMRKRWTTR